MRRSRYIVSLIDMLLLLAADYLILYSVYAANVLPELYYAVLVIVLAVINIAMVFLLFWSSKAKKGGRGRKPKGNGAGRAVFGMIVAIAMLVMGIFCSSAMGKLSDALGAISGDNGIDYRTTKVINYHVYVLADDPANTLGDAADYMFAMADVETKEVNAKCVEKLEGELHQKITTTGVKDASELIDSLYSGDVQAIVLNSMYGEILDESEGHQGFLSRVKSVYSFSVQIEIKSEDIPGSNPADSEPEDVVKDPFVVYISGSDTRSNVLKTSNSDVNLLAVVNPATKQVLLLNTPRDYFIPNPAGNGALDKLTHCGNYGVNCSMEALGGLYDVKVKYYAQINFSGFETLIDAIGGIDVESDVRFYAQESGQWVQKGMNHMNGYQALGFVRERYSLQGGDNARGKNQMKVIKAIIEKLSVGTLLNGYADIMESMQDMFATNMTRDEISKLVKMQLSDMATWNVQSFAVWGSDGSEITYSIPGVPAYVMYPNENAVAYAQKLIDKVMNGEILTEADMTMPK